MLRAAVIAAIAIAGCVDGIGPRPRPGTIDPGEEPGGGGHASLRWFELSPRVITEGTTDSVTVRASVSGTPGSVLLLMRSGQPVEMRPVDGLYTARLPVLGLMFGYRTGDLHQVGALIQVTAGDSVAEHPVVLNVKDASVPVTNVSPIEPGIQMSEHVLNIRHDGVSPGTPVPASVIRTFYNSFPDDYQFITIIESVQSGQPTFYTMVRNNTGGIGLAPFNNGTTYGSPNKLEGIIQFPDASDFDLARTDNIHEIAHRWMNYLENPPLSQARPHWPLSTLAAGIMGRHDAVTGGSSPFPFRLTQRADGEYDVATIGIPRAFNDLELYLMGLLPPDSVQPHVVFAIQNQPTELRNGGILRGATNTVRIEEIIATNGPRIPASNVAPRDIRIATIVLTRGGILTRHELDFYEHMAARGEARAELLFSNGVTRAMTQPFFLATGGRATLSTRLNSLR